MLYIYFLLYSVHLIIYRGTGNRLAVCAHRYACLLVFVGDGSDGGRGRLLGWGVIGSDGGRCVLIGGRFSWCWCVIGSDGVRCMLIGGRASWCWLVIVHTVGGVCSSVGVPPGVGG